MIKLDRRPAVKGHQTMEREVDFAYAVRLIDEHGNMLVLLREAQEALDDYQAARSSDEWELEDKSREMSDKIAAFLAGLEAKA